MYKIIIIIIIILTLLLIFLQYNIKNTMENNYNISAITNLPNIKTIPLNLFQTWETLDLPPKMKENIEILKKQNPEFKYHHINNI